MQETVFQKNLRLNNHKKVTKKPNSILTCKHFQEQGHNFDKDAKVIIIDKLVNLHGSKEAVQQIFYYQFIYLKLKVDQLHM